MSTHLKMKTDESNSSIRYYDASQLNRPFDMQKKFYPIVLIVALVGLLLGGNFALNTYDEVVNSQKYNEEEISAAIQANPTIVLPDLKAMINSDNDTIKNSLIEQGIQFVDMNNINGTTDTDGLDLMRLSEGTDPAAAALAYQRGISKLTSGEAATYLSGAWRLLVDRGEYTDMRVKYADFTSGSAEAAIQAARDAEGLTDAETSDQGVDNSGNTYVSGIVDVDGVTYNWQISACALSEIYSNDGLPSTSQYVGVRLYQ